MKTPLIAALSCLVLFSCKPDDVPNPSNYNSDYGYIAATGSYWVYDVYMHDSLGYQQLDETDSVYVVGDTVIDGKSYQQIKNTNSKFVQREFIRVEDETMYSHLGSVLFKPTRTDQLLGTDTISDFEMRYFVRGETTPIQTDAGTFNCLTTETSIRNLDQSPINSCDSIGYISNYFAIFEGEILSQMGMISDYRRACKFYERRLVRSNAVYAIE